MSDLLQSTQNLNDTNFTGFYWNLQDFTGIESSSLTAHEHHERVKRGKRENCSCARLSFPIRLFVYFFCFYCGIKAVARKSAKM